jgi:predicted  nucleic acid-binding Zn-ribbon protein
MNNPDFTTEQNDNLKTWAGQRDSLLSEISVLRTENEKLQKLNKDLAFSNLDIETRTSEIRGRLQELKDKENEPLNFLPKEVASLQSQKSVLESEITNLSKMVELLTSQKTSLGADVSFILSTFEVIKGETLLLDKVVDRVTQVSATNATRIDLLVSNLAASIEEIIEVNRKNVFETNVVIEKLPAMLMEAQKHGLIKHKT